MRASTGLVNNLQVNVAKGKICTALGIKLIPTTEIVSIAKDAGYDSLFIELEHSSFSLSQASQLCAAGIMSGITPFVRVPHQCGNGFVQRVLDGGAMGVIFPHISSVEEARAAVAICKFPAPAPGVAKLVSGKRSLTAGLPHFAYKPTSASDTMRLLDASGSTVILMIETAEAIANVDAIAAVPGVDVLLIGSNDLSLELGIQGQWDDPLFRKTLEKVANACKNSGTLLGLAGLYNRPDICADAIKRLGAIYILGNLDIGLVIAAAKANVEVLKTLE
ncbi:Pyruvate/Phosphoenolpyruvate kinase [Leptodontidium sp. MPI-SDFR-AT-0119]|nr:Pyruvate/Phosphoenolpyruvate kinase [Leptodontidium sp. MPI-SDFR-AT-0119]